MQEVRKVYIIQHSLTVLHELTNIHAQVFPLCES